MPERCFALIAGGGTAGHVLPGLAIARALVARGHDAGSIHYVGSQRGIEARLVPEAGFEVTLLPGRGIQRRLTPANIRAVGQLLRALGQALVLVRRRRPAVVVAVGGYASVAAALAALVWRVPVVVAEQNAIPGAANRLVGRFARAAAVSFPDTPLPRPVVTGNPVRPEVLAVDRANDGAKAKASLGVDPGRSLVLVFGGSLGARRINEAVLGALEVWRDRDDLAVRHVVGERDWEAITSRRPDLPPGGLQYEAIRYEDDMPRALAGADLAVCRAGSSTIFELAAVGLPSILVPSPFVTADHQTANARYLGEAGAARVLADGELTAAGLAASVDELLADPSCLPEMGAAARALARPDAADEVAALVEQHARPRSS